MANDVHNLFKTYTAISHEKISTGILPIDILSNGGIRLGSCIAIGGGEGAGKSSAFLQFAKNAIELHDKNVVYVDAEKSGAFLEQLESFDLLKYTQFSPDYDSSKPPKLYYINNLNTYGEFQDLCKKLIQLKAQLNYEIIILDSISALTQVKMIVGDCEANDIAYDAKPIAKLIKSIRGILYNAGISLFFVAQASSNIGGGMYDPQWYVKLTRAIKHTVDLLFVIEKPDYKKYKITVPGKSLQGIETDLEIGYKAKLWTIKNRVCRSQKIEVPYIYGRGIDNLRFLLTILTESKMLTVRAGVYKLNLNGTEEKFENQKVLNNYIKDNYDNIVSSLYELGQFDLSTKNYMLESDEDIEVSNNLVETSDLNNDIDKYNEIVNESNELLENA